MLKGKRVCVFCGSRKGVRTEYETSAWLLGQTLAERGIGIVYGGGNIGLMGVLADGALASGGEVIGVIPGPLLSRELAHNGLTNLHVVSSMHERKALMSDLSDAFIALPGGYGTLEEFCEILTWAQLGIHQKPCGLLNVQGYFDRLLEFFDHSVSEEFVLAPYRSLFMHADHPIKLLEMLESYAPIQVRKWIEREQR